ARAPSRPRCSSPPPSSSTRSRRRSRRRRRPPSAPSAERGGGPARAPPSGRQTRLAWVAMTVDTIPEGAIPVLDHGFVRLDGAMADDLSVVNAARVSFAQQSEELGERDQGLIRFLMRERHGTPFEHNAFRYHVKLPIFVMREWARHRIGSFNEWSARYSQLEPEFYIPEPQDVRTQVGKPGSYSFDPVAPELAEHTRDAQRA